MNGDPFNAVAGPSNTRNHAPVASSSSNLSLTTSSLPSPVPSTRPPPAPSIPPLYLPPPAVDLFVPRSSPSNRPELAVNQTTEMCIVASNAKLRDKTLLGPPLPQTLLASTQDLISRLNLLSAYDKYVRPNVVPLNAIPAPGVAGISLPDQASHTEQVPSAPVMGMAHGMLGTVDKGKGKEKEMVVDGPGGMGVSVTGDVGVVVVPEEEAGKGEKKKKNTYKHLIKGIPGKHSMKKDEYLSNMMLIPPKQRIQIVPFDARTQRDAFTVSLEGLKGWNIHALVLESGQAREDRKKRKELKRLAKAQAAAAVAAQQTGFPVQNQSAQPIHAPVPTAAPARFTAASPKGIATPRAAGASTPRPGGTTPRPVPRPGTTTATPVKAQVQAGSAASAVPRPGSAVPRPGSTKPPIKPTGPPSALTTAASNVVHTTAPVPTRPGSTGARTGPVKVSTPLRSGTPMQVDQQRGKKREREREDVVNGVTIGNGHGPPPASTMTAPKAAIDAKAGVVGVRPRPIKKQRMDVQGQTRDVATPVQQQPTPQGV
ncbi:hypothetical protein AX17_002291 [Amanita inopinata Kibby_2008]|nr:hypothetical protein AX17_002291 [Amanita inopinata Kibby_2008]